jgi:hypothetical protein
MRGARFTSVALALALLPFAPLACHGKTSSNVDAAATTSPQAGPPPSAPVNAIPVPAASIAKYVNPQNLPAYDGPTGSVEGTVRIDGPEPRNRPGLSFTSCPAAEEVYGKTYREGPPGPDGTRPLADALVAVTGYAGFYIPERKEAVPVTANDCSVGIRTVALTFGQRIEFANKTKEIYAPAFTQVPTPALMIANALTEPVKLYPPRPGYFTLVDTTQQHTYAQIDVYALLHPLHAVTDLQGHYRIDGVPVGKLKVDARLAAVQRNAVADVEVHAGVVEHVDLVIHAPTIPAGFLLDGGVPQWVK